MVDSADKFVDFMGKTTKGKVGFAVLLWSFKGNMFGASLFANLFLQCFWRVNSAGLAPKFVGCIYSSSTAVA